ncbi:MAG: alpha/beta fold hydrolase [Candidatus Acidiferrum sp.]|jgi:homoserine O-acetyltransferase
MNRIMRVIQAAAIAAMSCLVVTAARSQTNSADAKYPPTTEGDFVVHNFKFESGDTLADLKLHYTTLGKPAKDAQGRTTNAVLILHGTGGSGQQFLAPYFAGELFNSGQILDASRYYLILVDGVGHGKSSKPSDGLHAHFPQYDYADMVALHHKLLTEGLGVDHLRLIFGTSMGCMHSFVWGETYPDFMDALMPMACLPIQIAGRNRVWRKMLIDGIRTDPEWKNGDYATEPPQGIRIALDFLIIAGSAPIPMQKTLPKRDDADKFLDQYFHDRAGSIDANDILYQVSASRDYDPSANLEKIKAQVMWMNSSDDFINPPDLGIAEREVKRLQRGKFILIPASEQTQGHGTHTFAAIWKDHLAELLEKSAH